MPSLDVGESRNIIESQNILGPTDTDATSLEAEIVKISDEAISSSPGHKIEQGGVTLPPASQEEVDESCHNEMGTVAMLEPSTSLSRKEFTATTPTTTDENDPPPPSIVTNPKVKVHFVAVGNAPILKKSKFKIDPDVKFGHVINSLRRTLSLNVGDTNPSQQKSSLFLYCNAAFVPSPDERLGDLNDCFSTRGELVIHYSLKEAWG